MAIDTFGFVVGVVVVVEESREKRMGPNDEEVDYGGSGRRKRTDKRRNKSGPLKQAAPLLITFSTVDGSNDRFVYQSVNNSSQRVTLKKKECF